MVNAWSLLDSVINGTLDEDYPIMSKDDVTILGSDNDTVTFTVPEDAVGAADTINLGSVLPGGMGNDHISFGVGAGNTAYDYASAADFGDYYPTIGSVDDVYSHHFPAKPQPDLTSEATQKYGEDKGIKDLKDYVSSTYSGHYTSKNNNVQTLDLIQSVGDAESFCRSNAIKYLSRYDKKGQAKRDILKAMHYCLLLYYFSGQTQEDLTQHGYETF